jgi:hypothetical protein
MCLPVDPLGDQSWKSRRPAIPNIQAAQIVLYYSASLSWKQESRAAQGFPLACPVHKERTIRRLGLPCLSASGIGPELQR